MVFDILGIHLLSHTSLLQWLGILKFIHTLCAIGLKTEIVLFL